MKKTFRASPFPFPVFRFTPGKLAVAIAFAGLGAVLSVPAIAANSPDITITEQNVTINEELINIVRNEGKDEVHINGSTPPIDKTEPSNVDQYRIQLTSSTNAQINNSRAIDISSDTKLYGKDDTPLVTISSPNPSATLNLNLEHEGPHASRLDNTYGVGIQSAKMEINVPVNLTLKNDPQARTGFNMSWNGLQSYVSSTLTVHGDVAVRATLEKTGTDSLQFSGIHANGYEDDININDVASVITIDGTLNLAGSDLKTADSEARYYGILSNMGENTSDPVNTTVNGAVSITSNSVHSTGGKAQLTGIMASEYGYIGLRDLTIEDNQVTGSEGTGITAIHSATDSLIEVNGDIQIRNNQTTGDLTALRAEGGVIDISEGVHQIEGDLRAGLGNLYIGNDTFDSPIHAENPVLDWMASSSAVYEENGKITVGFTGSTAYLSGFTADGDVLTDRNGIGEFAEREISTINLTFRNGATWNVVPSNAVTEENGRYISRLTNLTLDNAHVYVGSTRGAFDGGFAASFQRLANTDKPVELEIGNLSGSGHFYLRTDMANDRSDSVNVTGTLSGTHTLHVKASGEEQPAEKQETSYLAKTGAGVAADRSAFTLHGGKVDLGVYNYELASREKDGGLEWYLTRSSEQPNESDGPDGADVPGAPARPEYSPTARAVLAMAATGAQNALYQNSLSDLRKRLGEVRDGVRDGLWASFAGWKDVLSGYASSRFRQEVYSVSLGLDRALSENWLAGAHFRAAIADQKTHAHDGHATGDADSQGISLYASWTRRNGTYADFVASIDRYGQEIRTNMLDGRETKGKYHNWGYGLSAEVGHKFDKLGNDRTWFIEPQAQLSWHHVKGDSFSMDNGMRVKQDNADSLTARLGVVAGRDLELEGRRKGQYYLKAGVNHELSGDQKVSLNGIGFEEHDIMGTRYYYGAGMDWELDRNTKLYGQIEREEGSHYTKEIEVRLGLKHSF